VTPSYRYRAELRRVIDGDTVELVVDLGFHVRVIEIFRLARINAPEMNTQDGKLAKLELINFLFQTTADLTVETFKTEKYGRWLGELWLGDVNVNDWMLENGFAVPYKGAT
jgi:micrococcal nuclease